MSHYSRDLLRSSDRLSNFDRLEVEEGSTALWEGREFHHVREFSISAGGRLVFRYEIPIPILLYGIELSIDAGSLRLSTLIQGTESGVWVAAANVHGGNNGPLGPHRRAFNGLPYARQVLVSSGGDVTGGIETDVLRVRTPTGQTATGIVSGTPHVLGPQTSHIILSNTIGTGTAEGIVRVSWEELRV